jgi:hypothetical protein
LWRYKNPGKSSLGGNAMQSKTHQASQSVLSCWKDIANYMGKGVRTVQRWEQDLALPVRRPRAGGPKGPVTALPTDLDQWLLVNWSERRTVDRIRHKTAARVFEANITAENPLIEQSRQLRFQNRLLLADLMQSIENLRLTCSTLELCRAPGKVAIGD